MDRNTNFRTVSLFDLVALRKESVDRNVTYAMPSQEVFRSLSARRAWIEILSRDSDGAYLVVALRKESVDRNLAVWAVEHAYQVALRKESVDRNHVAVHCVALSACRSPQGERG